MNRVKAVIIDDENYACERLRRLIASFPQVDVEGSFTSSLKGLEFINKHQPELIFLDVELENNVSAFDFIQALRSDGYNPYIVLVTAHTHYSIKAVRHQVFDYLLKPVDVDELGETISRLLKLVFKEPKFSDHRFASLSRREKEVLILVLEGRKSREIARLLFISLNTVHTHRRNILKKTGARSAVDLVKINNEQKS
jgi:DNA-binding NarL/FixJ family response regulator